MTYNFFEIPKGSKVSVMSLGSGSWVGNVCTDGTMKVLCPKYVSGVLANEIECPICKIELELKVKAVARLIENRRTSLSYRFFKKFGGCCYE